MSVEQSHSGSSAGRFRGGTIGRYQLLEELARGGMGVVWRAWDPQGEREVALKLLLSASSSSGDEKRRKRVLREAETLARLRHKNVVAVHDAGEHQGSPYLVLELVKGESLEQLLVRAGRLSPHDAARIGARLAGALRHAHAHDVLHRDLKPGNVLLRASDGEPLLTDFGLALDLTGTTTRLSQAGAFLGTPQYWPPEQARGELEQIGPWSDVYALGATLYHLVTGRHAHEGATLGELVAAASKKKTPVLALRSDVPPALAALIERCLETEPQARPELPALEEELGRLSRRASPAPARRAVWPLALAALGLSAAGLVAALALAGLGQSQPRLADPAAAASTLPTVTPRPGPTRPAEPADEPFPPGWEVLRLDPALFLDLRRQPSLEVFSPWCTSVRGEALRLQACGNLRTEVILPLDCGTGPFRLRAVLGLPVFEPGTSFALGLELPGDARVEARAPRLFLVGTQPGGQEQVAFSASLGEEAVLHQVPAAAPGPETTVTLELAYGGRGDPRLRFRCSTGAGSEEREVTLGAPFPSAVWYLRLGLNRHSSSWQHSLSLAVVDLQRVELAAPRGGATPARPDEAWERQLGRLGRRYLAGDLAEVARQGGEIALRATTENASNLFPAASFQEALALARLGRAEEATTQLVSFWKAGSLERDMLVTRLSWYEELAAEALPFVGRAERAAMAAAHLQMIPERDPEALRARARAQLMEGLQLRSMNPKHARLRFADAALTSLGLLGEALPCEPAVLGDALCQLGDLEGALASFRGETDPRARLGEGLACLRLGRWQESVAAFERAPREGLPPEEQAAVATLLGRARARLAEGAVTPR